MEIVSTKTKNTEGIHLQKGGVALASIWREPSTNKVTFTTGAFTTQDVNSIKEYVESLTILINSIKSGS